jgi:hypothetical protein
MNHTDVPPTRLVMDLFDVSPAPTNGLGYYRDYWFFTNLQVHLFIVFIACKSTQISSYSFRQNHTVSLLAVRS